LIRDRKAKAILFFSPETYEPENQINARMFAYNADKQAEIQDARAGTFQELVRAAELCPPAIIHPGTPLDPNERDLEQWVERAKPFN